MDWYNNSKSARGADQGGCIMKIIRNWKVMLFVLIVAVFSSLYGFIYLESVKLPSEGWSGSIPIETYQSAYSLREPDKRNALALSNGSEIIYINGSESGLDIRKFGPLGEKMESKSVPFEYGVDALNGQLVDGSIELVTVSESANTLNFVVIDGDTFELLSENIQSSQGQTYQLSKTHGTTFYDDVIEVFTGSEIKSYKGLKPEIVPDSILTDQGSVVAFVDNYMGNLKLHVLKDTGNNITTVNIASIPVDGSTKPTKVQLIQTKSGYQVLVSLLNTKLSFTSLNTYTMSESLEDVSITSNDLASYNGVPYYDERSKTYLMGIYDNNLGRTEVARGKSVYPNFYQTDDIRGLEFTQLTNTERIGRLPYKLEVAGYEYLIHNEYSGSEAIIYMTSTNPDVIKRSRSLEQTKPMEVFIKTIVNYPAVMFSGIIPTVSILLPVLCVCLPFMMLKLSWVEQNKKTTVYMTLGLYTLSKFYVYASDIFKNFSSANILPDYLASSSGHWSVLLCLSLATIGIAFSRANQVKHLNESFMKNLALYMLLDVTVLNLFFLPYTII